MKEEKLIETAISNAAIKNTEEFGSHGAEFVYDDMIQNFIAGAKSDEAKEYWRIYFIGNNIKIMKEQKLRELFKINSDCIADTNIFENDGSVTEGKVIQAMTEDKFIEIIKQIINEKETN